jgi:hypothetical protein
MNNIDAVEGLAKVLLGKFLDVSVEGRQEVSEYIGNVKTVIDAVGVFIKNNPEVSETPELVRDVLYDFAKSQWMGRLEKMVDPDPATGAQPDLDYQAYCYDYIYIHGNYPR